MSRRTYAQTRCWLCNRLMSANGGGLYNKLKGDPAGGPSSIVGRSFHFAVVGSKGEEIERLHAQLDAVRVALGEEQAEVKKLQAQVVAMNEGLLSVWQFCQFSLEIGKGRIIPPSLLREIEGLVLDDTLYREG